MFHNVLLPETYSYQSRRNMVSVVQEFLADSGDRTVFTTNRTLFRYDLSYANRTSSALADLRRFYYCRRGGLISFKFFDPTDYTSAANGIAAPTGLDQTILSTGGNYYLAKQYGTYNRIINLPISGTVIITDGGVDVTGSCTVNSFTGRITGYTPTGAFKAGFQFYVPVRFSTDPFSPAGSGDGDNYSVSFGLAEVLEALQ